MMLSPLLPSLPENQIQQLDQLADLFLEWNGKLNLSAIRDRDGVLLKHIVDSLLILPFGWIQEGWKVMDLGTGGGFPGLALAITHPDTSFTLVDATEKKVKAVQAMAQSLGLHNVTCQVGRAEELGRDKQFREQFDLVVARALAGFSTLLEYCMPFVKVDGKFIAYQGPELLETWKDFADVAHVLSSAITEVKEAELPIEEAKRCFVVVKKLDVLSQQYPRENGIPKKKPLGS